MPRKQLGHHSKYIYSQLSQQQATLLVNARAAVAQEEATYSGPLSLTEREYYLLLPLLNPLVIVRDRRRLKELCRVAEVPKKCQQRMARNLWLQACIGFVPLANVVFTRKFKSNTRNLAILEAQMQLEEDELFFRKSDGSASESSLPTHVAKMFSMCPVYKRADAEDSWSRRQSIAKSVYHSTCASLSELGHGRCAESGSSTLDGSSMSAESMAAAAHTVPRPTRHIAVA